MTSNNKETKDNIHQIKTLIISKDKNSSKNPIKNITIAKNIQELRSNLTTSKISKAQFLLSIEKSSYQKLHKKYFVPNTQFDLFCCNCLIKNAACSLVSQFKENMVLDYLDEFLKRSYILKESKERIPKFYLYYKHYSIFFGQPFFSNLPLNKMLQRNGEKKARIYYKNHYQNGESKDNDNENGFAESGSESESEENKLFSNNENGNIFNSKVKNNIDNVTTLTTISYMENNTINLGLNNERIEIFSENKKEKSNDTTVVDLMDDINKSIKKLKKDKNGHRNVKKKNYSLGENFYNMIKKNINSNKNVFRNKQNLMDLINQNNSIKGTNSKVKKKLFLTKTNQNLGSQLPSATNRAPQKKKINLIKNENTTSNNGIINSNKMYKKRKMISFGNDDVNKIFSTDMKYNQKNKETSMNKRKLNSNFLSSISINNNNTSKTNEFKKLNSPVAMNKKVVSKKFEMENTYSNKANRISKNFSENKKNITTKKMMSNNLFTVGEEKRVGVNKLNLNIKKLAIDNYAHNQAQMSKEKISKKVQLKNTFSPLDKKKLIDFSNTFGNDQEYFHQRNKSNFLQNSVKKHIYTYKVINTENSNNKAYIKPAIRIKKNEKFLLNKQISVNLNENKHRVPMRNNYLSNNIGNNKTNDLKNTNFNKYLLEVIKKSKYQHYNSLTGQVEPNKTNKNKDLFQFALSLLVNEASARKDPNRTNILEPYNHTTQNLNTNTKTFYKDKNGKVNEKNKNKKYNLNINIKNEININENNTINNNTYRNNSNTQRLDHKSLNKKYIDFKLKKPIHSSLAKNDNYFTCRKNDTKSKNFNTNNNLLNNNNSNHYFYTFSSNQTNNQNKNNKDNIMIKSYNNKIRSNYPNLIYHNKKFAAVYNNLNKSK